MLKNPFKLQKLTITAYDKVDRAAPSMPPFEAMFNPESYTQNFETEYDARQGIGTNPPELEFMAIRAQDLNLTLILDGTGASEMGPARLLSKSVHQRIEDFKKTAYNMNGTTHQPNFLTLRWGKLSFPCRLRSLSINYTLFNRDGTPLRAELSTTFVSDAPSKKQNALTAKSSPDLTHLRTINAGDTLPGKTDEIYNNPGLYIQVAKANKLNNFRRLNMGQQLTFPPIR